MDSFDRALRYALNILNRRDYTEFEMLSKLNNRGFEKDVIDNTIKYLKEKKLIDDERYADNFIYFKLKNGYGKKRIEYELKKKGIDGNIINKYLQEVDEGSFIKEVFEKKLTTLKNSRNKKSKLYSFLVRRGYGYDLINEILNNSKERLI